MTDSGQRAFARDVFADPYSIPPDVRLALAQCLVGTLDEAQKLGLAQVVAPVVYLLKVGNQVFGSHDVQQLLALQALLVDDYDAGLIPALYSYPSVFPLKLGEHPRVERIVENDLVAEGIYLRCEACERAFDPNAESYTWGEDGVYLCNQCVEPNTQGNPYFLGNEHGATPLRGSMTTEGVQDVRGWHEDARGRVHWASECAQCGCEDEPIYFYEADQRFYCCDDLSKLPGGSVHCGNPDCPYEPTAT